MELKKKLEGMKFHHETIDAVITDFQSRCILILDQVFIIQNSSVVIAMKLIILCLFDLGSFVWILIEKKYLYSPKG